ncbi:MAG: type II toxin-antitoxin system RelB/DinJ family antitoxin, partial [Lachnospiraceae bacterium]|nr:type II toxin-antitoxin system RelB/DinJ family antitoxin [Lachnospiraceae bacterium]
MSSTIQVRVDDDLKTRSDELFRRLGTDTTSAIRMFLTQSLLNNGFPFELKIKNHDMIPYEPLTEGEIFARLEKSRNQAMQGRLRDADDVISDMRGKYG